MTNSTSLAEMLPVDLAQLVHLVCVDPFVQLLVHSTTNHFFTTTSSSPPTVDLALDSPTGQTCWGLLPQSWRDHFDSVPVGQRDTVLAELSIGRTRVSCPPHPRGTSKPKLRAEPLSRFLPGRSPPRPPRSQPTSTPACAFHFLASAPLNPS